MALAENAAGSSQPEKPANEHPNKPDRRDKPSTKVIIRRLPPSITQEDFLNQVSPAPDYDYIYSVKGDASLGENSFSRVYINFVHHEDIFIFKEKFDNYVFVDEKGHEYPAVVEYSSFQKVPKRRKARPDPKLGSIESDPIYLEFLESLKEQPVQEEKPEYSYQPSNVDKNDVSTPLLDYLKQRKMDRMRIREEKREEKRKKEIERKKLRDDDRRKRMEEKIIAKNKNTKEEKEVKKEEEVKEKPVKEKEEKSEEPAEKVVFVKAKEKKPAVKPKFNKYEDRKEFNKSRREDHNRDYHKPKFEEGKKEFTKKVKKYSERREERKQEQKRDPEDGKREGGKREEKGEGRRGDHGDECEGRGKNKENDPRAQRRIKNKDRPAMVLYKPGMLRKKSVDNDKDRDKEKEREQAVAEAAAD